ncbi:MAG: TraX family protein [Cellulosilyticaceae bacterium]
MLTRQSFKILNAWDLKLIMTVLMVLNHLEYVYGLISPDLRMIFILTSRCVAPLFAYLAVQGVLYTSNLKKYCIRLATWALIVTTSNQLLGSLLTSLTSDIDPQYLRYLTIRTNITITLAMGVLSLALIIWSQNKQNVIKVLYYIAAILCFIIGFICEWGVVLLPFMLGVYFFRENKLRRYVWYGIVEIISILFRFEIYYFFVFPFLALYDGKRGPNSWFHKYFFYIFYPLHLWIIAITNFILLSNH